MNQIQHYHQSIKRLLKKKNWSSLNRCLQFSLTIYDPTPPFLWSLYPRFSNLNTLDLTCYYSDLEWLLFQISRFPLKLTSLNFSNQGIFPVDGLRDFSQNITTLTSLTCYHLATLDSISDLFLIVDCFPLLEELDLSYPEEINYRGNLLDGVEAISLSLNFQTPQSYSLLSSLHQRPITFALD